MRALFCNALDVECEPSMAGLFLLQKSPVATAGAADLAC